MDIGILALALVSALLAGGAIYVVTRALYELLAFPKSLIADVTPEEANNMQ
jgi:hypothetical protein